MGRVGAAVDDLFTCGCGDSAAADFSERDLFAFWRAVLEGNKMGTGANEDEKVSSKRSEQ